MKFQCNMKKNIESSFCFKQSVLECHALFLKKMQGPQFQNKVTTVGGCIAVKNTLGYFQMTKGIGQGFTYCNRIPWRKKRNNY